MQFEGNTCGVHIIKNVFHYDRVLNEFHIFSLFSGGFASKWEWYPPSRRMSPHRWGDPLGGGLGGLILFPFLGDLPGLC